MRSDSVLNTGVTGFSLGNYKRKKERLEAKRSMKDTKKNKLLSSIDIITEEIDKEVVRSTELLLATVSTDTPEDQVKTIIVATKMYRESMDTLRNRLNNIMRVKE